MIEIPCEGRHLHGYFFPSPYAGLRPALIVTGGYDSTAEEAHFFSGPAAFARGYHVLTYDGPGQGAELIEAGDDAGFTNRASRSKIMQIETPGEEMN